MIRFHIRRPSLHFEEPTQALSSVGSTKQKTDRSGSTLHDTCCLWRWKLDLWWGCFALNKFCFKLFPERRNWKVRVKPYQEYSSNRLISSGNHPSPGQMEFPPERLYDIFYLFYRNLRSPPSMLLLWPSDTLRRWESTNRKVSQAAMSWNGSCHLVNRWKRRCFITFS